MFDKECNLIPVKAFKQHWTQKTFSYLEKPRPDYGIMLVLNGQIDFASSDEEIVCAKAGDVAFLPKSSHYEARFRIEFGEIDNYLINFESDRDLSFTKPVVTPSCASSCADLFEQFVDENYNVESMNFRSKGLFYLLLESVLSENEPQKNTPNKVFEKAKALLKNAKNIPISQIARACSVSESGLRKIFKDNMGISPAKFRMNEKIGKAKYLLESTDMSVDEISDKLNFFDTAYFCKTFSKYEGISPGKYSKSKKL